MQAYNPNEEIELKLYRPFVQQREDGVYVVTLNTSRGPILCELYVSHGSKGAIIWSAAGRPGSSNPRRPAVYAHLAQELTEQGISSLRVFFRMPGAEPGPFEECVLDILGGISFLKGIGAGGIAVVGHSFSAAVAIKAATLSKDINAVVALASQLYGTADVAKISPRPLLLVHGMEDNTIEYIASQILYDKAGDPKEVVFIDGAGHGFREKPEELTEILRRWLVAHIGPQAFGEFPEPPKPGSNGS